MTKKELRSAKEGYTTFFHRVNLATDQQLRDLIKEKYGLAPAPDALEADMRQTLMVWSLDNFFPS